MLDWVWREGDSPTLLLGMQIGSATVENSIEVQKKKTTTESRATI